MFLQKDSESDYDESMEISNSTTIHTNAVKSDNFQESVKTEVVDYHLPMSVPRTENIPSMFDKNFMFEDKPKLPDDDYSLVLNSAEDITFASHDVTKNFPDESSEGVCKMKHGTEANKYAAEEIEVKASEMEGSCIPCSEIIKEENDVNADAVMEERESRD